MFQACDSYSVLFEDTSYPDGYSPPLNIAQRYVIMYKEDKKKWKQIDWIFFLISMFYN